MNVIEVHEFQTFSPCQKIDIPGRYLVALVQAANFDCMDDAVECEEFGYRHKVRIVIETEIIEKVFSCSECGGSGKESEETSTGAFAIIGDCFNCDGRGWNRAA